MPTTRPVQPHEWPHYRALRLRALHESPDAFASTHAAESAQPDATWSTRLSTALESGHSHILFALDNNLPSGLAWAKLAADEPGTADLYQMWVQPESRGKGLGQALLDAVLDWAKFSNLLRIRLGVTADNGPATRLYTANGFNPAGPLEPLREGSALMSQPMELRLDNR